MQTGRSRTGGARRTPVAVLVWLGACATLALSGCGTDQASAGTPADGRTSGMAADALTQRIAEVEVARQCAVGSLTFAEESGITADLDGRLAAVGLTHAQWKDWHDALVDSPDLVAQLAEVGAPGCPGA